MIKEYYQKSFITERKKGNLSSTIFSLNRVFQIFPQKKNFQNYLLFFVDCIQRIQEKVFDQKNIFLLYLRERRLKIKRSNYNSIFFEIKCTKFTYI